MTATKAEFSPKPGWIRAEDEAFAIASDIEGSIATARHELDAIWGAARDVCGSDPEWDGKETRTYIDDSVHKLQQSLWCAEEGLGRLRDWVVKVMPVLRCGDAAGILDREPVDSGTHVVAPVTSEAVHS